MTQNVPTEKTFQTVELLSSQPASPELRPPEPMSPAGYALASAIVPGLGQLAQRRPATAALQFATVAAYVASAYAAGSGKAMWLAVLWNAWSSIEAYWRSPRR